jgi:hypothetical protein
MDYIRCTSSLMRFDSNCRCVLNTTPVATNWIGLPAPVLNHKYEYPNVQR